MNSLTSLLRRSAATVVSAPRVSARRRRSVALACALGLLPLSLAGTPRALAQAGTLDLTFDPGTGADAEVFYVSARPDGKVLVSGDFFFVNGLRAPGLTRLNADGSRDNDFLLNTDPNSGPDFFVSAVDVGPDGKIAVGGDFTLFNGQPRLSFAQLNPDGSLTSFGGLKGQGTNGRVSAIKVQPDGKVIIGGDFPKVDGEDSDRLARLKTDGSYDGKFRRIPRRFGFFATPVAQIVIQPDGFVLLAGLFGTTEPYARNGFKIARVNQSNTVDQRFNPGQGASGINGVVNAIAVQLDSKIIIGGTFRTVRNQVVGGIARLNTNGSLDTSFNPGVGFDQSVNAVVIQPNGKILVGGFFGFYNGVSRNGIARLNQDGSLDTSFDPGAGANAEINAISLQADGKIIIGGDFLSYGGVARQRIARLNNNPQ